MPDSQRISVMSLLFKKGNRQDLNNYRPLSLSNTDYKILASILASRLQKVIGKLVNHDQTAYIKGRNMSTNIRLVNDIIDYFDETGKSGLLFMADFKKAFDSLEWSVLFKTLTFFIFGKSFCKWINTIYTKPEGCIKNNGYISEHFELERGIRQGCPVSALLFVLAVEVLALKVRQCPNLKGLNIGSNIRSLQISQYADDAILFLNNKNEYCTAIAILNDFGKHAGTMLNLKKCEGMWIGVDKDRQENGNLFGIKWPSSIKYLGVYLGHNKKQI